MSTEDRPAPRGGRADKRAMILDGALRVFARCGYAGAGIDGIAKEARVSTRTIYNHFRDKAELYQAVRTASVAFIADHHVALIDDHLRRVDDLAADLTSLAVAWSSPRDDHEPHFTLFRQDASVIPGVSEELEERWHRDGPVRVRSVLAQHLERLADEGLLRIDDPALAALQFSVLVSLPDPSHRRSARSAGAVERIAAAGVRTFLYGHATARQ
ncbi:TetR/AcrR family transcriptional regulator [Nocardiopsis aegyptia]|uniref:TetR/AcrR family transcriptional regulator n=1 Tax=Nocardiopsis aegyptia TaxID=220378 RepID=UPI0036710DCA